MRRAWKLPLLLLMLGAMTTVAVAQACAAWRSVGSADLVQLGTAGNGSCRWHVSVHERAGVRLMQGSAASRMMRGIASSGVILPQTSAALSAPQRWPFTECAPHSYAQAVEVQAGWPWVALRGAMVGEPGGPGWQVIEQRGCIAKWNPNPALGAGVGDFRVLPLTPMWSGLLLDSLIWACAWGALAALMSMARRNATTLTPHGMRCLALGCVLLGIATTFLVALGCALFVDENARDGSAGDAHGQSYRGPGYRIWWVARAHEPGATRWVSRWISGGEEIGFTGTPPKPSAQECVPPWAWFLQPRLESDLDEREVIADARGWPLAAFAGGYEVERIGSAWPPTYRIGRSHAGIVLERYDLSSTIDAYRTRFIPLRPLWSGLLIDSAIYAAAWMLVCMLLLGPGALRRSLRRYRGQCLACGYDLRSIASERCPECGAARDSIATTSSTHVSTRGP